MSLYSRDLPPILHTITPLEDLKNKNNDITMFASDLSYIKSSVPLNFLPYSLCIYKFIPLSLIQLHSISIYCIYFFRFSLYF